MTTNTRYYCADDPSAPVLTGQAGALHDLLKKLLYGDGSGVAYGTGPDQKLAAGWSVLFDSGNKIALKNSLAAGGSGAVCRIDDTGSGAGGTKEALLRTYGAMSDVDTGTDPAPTVAQLATGSIIRKSATTDSTARWWQCAADERTFYFEAHSEDAGNITAAAYATTLAYGGDFESFVPGDGYAYGAAGRSIANTASGTAQGLLFGSNGFNAQSSPNCIFIGRGYAGTGTAVPANMSTFAYASGNGWGDPLWALANPDLGAGDEVWAPHVLISEGTIRGRMRGIYLPLCAVNGVLAGTHRTSVPGLPSGHRVTIFRGGTRNIVGTNCGGLGIETALAW